MTNPTISETITARLQPPPVKYVTFEPSHIFVGLIMLPLQKIAFLLLCSFRFSDCKSLRTDSQHIYCN